MAHQSFAQTVVNQLITLFHTGIEVDAGCLSKALHLQTRKDHKRLLNTLSDLSRSGKVIRVRQGVYAPAISKNNPDKREVMWRVMRMRRAVTIADLEEMAGVSSTYAKEWLELLVRREVAMRIVPTNPNHPHSWRLIKSDLVEMPVDEEKAARLRDIRRRKKAAITGKLDAIDTALGEVRQILKNLEEE